MLALLGRGLAGLARTGATVLGRAEPGEGHGGLGWPLGGRVKREADPSEGTGERPGPRWELRMRGKGRSRGRGWPGGTQGTGLMVCPP